MSVCLLGITITINMWNKLSMKDKAKYIKLGVTNGISSLGDIINAYNQYAEGGNMNSNSPDGNGRIIKDSWKPWYWGTPVYDAPSLKEALFKAYDDGLRGKEIMYKDYAYKVDLSGKDLREYNTRRQHRRNKRITNEQVVDNYLDNVLYTMENPTNKGFIDGKYYPYADSSSPKNIGPGVNFTSEIGKELDFSGRTGYTKEELNEIIKPYLMTNMEGIMTDLHNQYGQDADTMSLGNREILLDISYNVRPRGSKRANMPTGWPSLVEGMMTGDTEKVRENTYSGSTRRRDMRNDLIWQNYIDINTVKNR